MKYKVTIKVPNSTKSNYFGECSGKRIFLLVIFFLLF